MNARCSSVSGSPVRGAAAAAAWILRSRRAVGMLLVFAATACGDAVVAEAQQRGGPQSGGVIGGGPGTAPFSGGYRRPAISPYTMMANYGQNPAMFPNIYQQQVQPQLLQQQQQMEQISQSRQLSRLQNQVQQIQRDTSARQIDETIRPTGHRTTFQNYSHFYPMGR